MKYALVITTFIILAGAGCVPQPIAPQPPVTQPAPTAQEPAVQKQPAAAASFDTGDKLDTAAHDLDMVE